MTGLRMTLLAEQRRNFLKQRRINRSVRRVAKRAVFGHRRVFPQERAAFFRVAGVARLIHCRFRQQSGRVRSVRAMTFAARYQAEPHGMYGRLVEIRALFLVALVTNLGLAGCREHRIVLGV